jgi:hypothetical protein
MTREQLDKHAAKMRRENTEHITKSDAAIGGWRKRRQRESQRRARCVTTAS